VHKHAGKGEKRRELARVGLTEGHMKKTVVCEKNPTSTRFKKQKKKKGKKPKGKNKKNEMGGPFNKKVLEAGKKVLQRELRVG